jgi:hypothetical protein
MLAQTAIVHPPRIFSSPLNPPVTTMGRGAWLAQRRKQSRKQPENKQNNPFDDEQQRVLANGASDIDPERMLD